MATLRKGSRVRHADYPERVGRVMRCLERWDAGERRWERAAEVDWDGDWPTWELARDLVLVRRATAAVAPNRSRRG
jgi:hypothetical protein